MGGGGDDQAQKLARLAEEERVKQQTAEMTKEPEVQQKEVPTEPVTEVKQQVRITGGDPDDDDGEGTTSALGGLMQGYERPLQIGQAAVMQDMSMPTPEMMQRRRRIMRSVDMTKEEKEAVASDYAQMKAIIASHKEDAHVKNAAKRVKYLQETLVHWQKQLAENKMMPPAVKLERIYQFCVPFEGDIEIYKNLYVGTLSPLRDQKIDMLLSRYATLRNFHDMRASGDVANLCKLIRSVDLPLLGLRDMKDMTDEQILGGEKEFIEMHDRAHILNGEENPDDRDDDEDFSEEQLKAIAKIDRLLVVESTHDVGFAFVSKLLSLPNRQKMLIYYLAETGRAARMGDEDIIRAYSAYTPTIAGITTTCKTSKFNLWRRLKGTTFDWDKIAEAYQAVKGVKIAERLENVGMKPSEVEEELELRKSVRYEQGKDPNHETIRRTKETIDTYFADDEKSATFLMMTMKRSNALYSAIETLRDIQDLTARKEAKESIDDTDYDAEIEAAQRVAQDYIEKMREANDEMRKYLEKNPDIPLVAKPDETIADAVKKAVPKGMKIAGTGSSLLGKGGAAALQVLGLVDWKNIVTSVAEFQGVIEKIGYVAAGTAAVGALGFLVSLVGTKKGWKGSSDGARAESVLSLTSAGINVAKSAVIAAQKIGYSKEIVTKVTDCAALNHLSSAASGLGIASVAASGTLCLAQTGLSIYQGVRQGQARAGLKETWTESRSSREISYEKNVLSLGDRIKVKKGVLIGMNATATALNVAGLALAAETVGVSTALNLLGIGIGLFSMGAEKAMSKGIMEDKINDFLHTDKAVFAQKTVEDMTGMREYMTEEMMGELGFASKEAFSKHISVTYAKHIVRKMFYDRYGLITEGRILKAGTPEPDDAGTVHYVKEEDLLPYINLCKSFGVRVRYPQNADDKDIRPSVLTLVGKMG